MKKISFILYFLILFSACTNADNPEDLPNKETCNFFLIKEVENEILVEKVQLQKDQVQIFKDENIVSYVMMFSPGSKSGEIIQAVNRIHGIIAQFDGNTIKVSILNKDGTQKEMPDINLETASKTDVRLNVTGAKGYSIAYFIEKFSYVRKDNGPVLDMFAGKFPLNVGDYSLFTECLESKSSESLIGKIPYYISDNWITVDCELPNGESGKFIVDFGASNTVISKDGLPKDALVLKYEMVKHSSEGIESSNAVTQGASGTVDNISGIYVIDSFNIGNIEIKDFKAVVLNQFPKIFKEKGITGIIGRDILMKSEIVTVNNLTGQTDEKFIEFKRAGNECKNCDKILPFEIAGGHLFFEGKIDNYNISYLFDSGAGTSWISKNFIDKHAVSYKITDEKVKTAYGLDGKGIEFINIEIGNIKIGNIVKENMRFDMSDIFVLQSMGINDETALLGMDFILNYNNVCIDFQKKQMLLSN